MPTPSPGFPVAGKNPELLITEVNKRFTARENRIGSEVLRRICFIDTGSISKSGVYPVAVLGFKDQVRGDTEKRDFDEASSILLGPIVAERRDGPAVVLPIDDDYDLYGIISQGLDRQIVPWGLRLWVRLIAGLINGNGTPNYDTLSFFNTAHLVNPLRPELSTFSNDKDGVATEIDEDGWAFAGDAMMDIKSLSGVTLANQGMVKPIVIVPSQKLWIKALRLFKTPNAVIGGVGGVAASFTVVTTDMADVVYLPELVDPADAATKKRWYVASDTGYWPLIIRETQPPQVKMTKAGGHLEDERDAKGLYARAKVGVGFGLPHTMMRFKTA